MLTMEKFDDKTVFTNDTEDNVSSEDIKGCFYWIKKHKKELIISGLTITAIVGIILGIKNKDELINYFNNLVESVSDSKKIKTAKVVALPINAIAEETDTQLLNDVKEIRTYSIPSESYIVKAHIRKLAGGMVHSHEKALEAEKLGIILKPNETLVKSYTKYEPN